MRIDRFVYGAGGHASVVVDAALCLGENLIVLDDDIKKKGSILLGIPVGYMGDFSSIPSYGHLAIGDNEVRRRIFCNLNPVLDGWFNIFHPDSSVSRFSNVEDGVFVAAQAVVAPSVEIGTATIINHGAVVDHECRVGRFCHIGPNATLGGRVKVGEGVLIGSGAVVLPGVSIGDGVVIGAGSVVTRDVREDTTVVGVPAKEMHK